MKSARRTVAVVGAGISGLTCARELADRDFVVSVFDKGRNAGGRTATRRIENCFQFDHGAQYFTARDPQFLDVTADWLARGIVAEWHGTIVRLERGEVSATSPQARFVGVPGMTAMAKDLASGLSMQSETEVVSVEHGNAGWTITTASHGTFGPFDMLVVTLPAPQAANLLAQHPFRNTAADISMTPCWAVMVAFQSRIEVPWDGAFVHSSLLSWVARNSSKPGRSVHPDCWVLHAGGDWSRDHLEITPEIAASEILDAFAAVMSLPLPNYEFLKAHRWRFSHGSDANPHRILCDPTTGLVSCGDWLSGGRVEGAFLSGLQAAEAIRSISECSSDAE